MLDDFSREMDTTETKMDNVMKKVAKVLHMSSGKNNSLKMCLCIIYKLLLNCLNIFDIDAYYTYMFSEVITLCMLTYTKIITHSTVHAAAKFFHLYYSIFTCES